MVQKVKLTKRHLDKAAQQITEIWWDREASPDRQAKVRIWKEVDRQVAMIAVPQEKHSGLHDDWLPETELPLQASALEVLQADARQLTFPRNNKWFVPHSNISKEYTERWTKRRAKSSIFDDDPQPMELNQGTSDLMVKSVVDHFHRLFNFRRAADAMDISALKYGTYATKIRSVELPILDGVYRGSTVTGPAAIPIRVQTLYLDDKKDQITMEGQEIAPSTIRVFWRRPSGLGLQAQDDDSFVQMNKLDNDGDKMITLLEFEGDLIIPMSRETLFMPNMTIWVALNAGGPLVIRRFKNEDHFRSIITGTYMNDDPKSPYGTSPLMKGQPIQELATQLTNNLSTAAALAARPPLAYDPDDGSMAASGGPEMFPGSRFKSDDPQTSVRRFRNWNVGEIQSALLLALTQYEDLTGVTAPRRGAPAKSHTTATAAEVEQIRGLVRTDDYVQSKEKSILEPILEMEWSIIKRTMDKQAILIDTGAEQSFANIARQDLPDDVIFDVIGSSGPMTERQKQDKKMAAIQAALQIDGVIVSQGRPSQFDAGAAIQEILQDAFENPDKFKPQSASVSGNAPVTPPVQGVAPSGAANGAGTI